MNPSASAHGPGQVSGANAPDAGLAPTTSPAIDPATLARLHELDPDGSAGIVPRVLRAYDGALTTALAGIATAADRRSAAELRHLTHTLKSSSASVGALHLAIHCGDAERLAREGWSDALVPQASRLVEEGRRVQAALQLLLPQGADARSACR